MPNPAGQNATSLPSPPIHHDIHENQALRMQSEAQDPVECLKAAKNRREAVEAIFEIVGAQIGGAEAALYAVESGFSTLRLIGSRGIGAHVLIRKGAGRIGEAAVTGKEYVVDTSVPPSGKATDDRLTICLPLSGGETPSFVLAVYGLLPPGKHLLKKDATALRFLKDQAGPMLSRLPE